MNAELPHSPTLFIFCGNATYNRGDRGNLAAQIDLLRSTFPESKIITSSYRPDIDCSWYGIDVVRRGTLFLSHEEIAAIRQSDIVIWGGGALIADNNCMTMVPYWFFTIGFIRWILCKPVMAWAHGIVIRTRLGAWLGRKTLNWSSLITVRDENSLETLRHIGATRPMHSLTADPAILLTPDSPEIGEQILRSEGIDPLGKKLFAIIPSFWSLLHEENDILPYHIARILGLRRKKNAARLDLLMQNLSAIADRIIEEHDARVVFLPMYPSNPWNDCQKLEQIRSAMKHRHDAFILRRDDYSPRKYLALWHHFACSISNSLHHTTFATIMRTPCLNFYYEKKGQDFFTAIDGEHRMAPFDILFQQPGIEVVMRMMKETLQSWPEQCKRMEPRIEELKERARYNATLLRSLFGPKH